MEGYYCFNPMCAVGCRGEKKDCKISRCPFKNFTDWTSFARLYERAIYSNTPGWMPHTHQQDTSN